MDYISKIFQHLYSVHLQIVINYDIIDDSFDILICTFLINLYFIKKFYQPIDNAERVKAQAQAAFGGCPLHPFYLDVSQLSLVRA